MLFLSITYVSEDNVYPKYLKTYYRYMFTLEPYFEFELVQMSVLLFYKNYTSPFALLKLYFFFTNLIFFQVCELLSTARSTKATDFFCTYEYKHFIQDSSIEGAPRDDTRFYSIWYGKQVEILTSILYSNQKSKFWQGRTPSTSIVNAKTWKYCGKLTNTVFAFSVSRRQKNEKEKKMTPFWINVICIACSTRIYWVRFNAWNFDFVSTISSYFYFSISFFVFQVFDCVIWKIVSFVATGSQLWK